MYNNIFYFTAPNQKALKHASGKVASDYNIFYPEQDGFVEISNISYNKLEQLQQELSIDLKSFTSDPLFVDVYTDNFTVEASSPAIDAGINLNLGKDFFGELVPVSGFPDIGIFELTGNLFRKTESVDNNPVLTVYPNPSTGLVNFEIINTETGAARVDMENVLSEVSVVDISGKRLFSKVFELTESVMQDNIDLTDLSNGFYFVVLRIADKIITEKIVLEH
jgi:hypothetical protein